MPSRLLQLLVCLMLSPTVGQAGAPPSVATNTAARDSSDNVLDADEVAAFFDAAFAVQQQDHRLAGVVVAVVQHGEVLFQKGYGWADLEARVPADAEQSLFRIASISKTFVWTALMQLVERGLVDLDADVNRYLDFQVPDTLPEPILVKHLMAHTAGFEDRNIGTSARRADEVLPLREFLVTTMPERVRTPGSAVAYSNYGSALAGYIIERVTGESWSDYVDRHVLQPLRMHSTNVQVTVPPALVARHAVSYTFDGGGLIPAPFSYMHDNPAGVMSSTAADMARYMLVHLGRGKHGGVRILESETALRMQTPLFSAHPAIGPVLHGFFRSDQNGEIILGHGGDTNQFHSDLKLFPERGIGLFVSFNSDPGAAARDGLVAAFVDRFLPAEHRPAASTPANVDLADYTGEYLSLRSNHSTIERLAMLVSPLVIREEGAYLVTSRDDTRWLPLGDDTFAAVPDGQTMVFERNPAGQVNRAIVGHALNTFDRVKGLESPAVIRGLAAAMLVVALGSLLGYGYRALQRAPPTSRLGTPDILIAWTFAALAILLYIDLGAALGGDIEEFLFGVPTWVHVNLWFMNLNVLLALVVIGCALRQWLMATGSILARTRYSLIAVAAAIHIGLASYFNMIGYLLE